MNKRLIPFAVTIALACSSSLAIASGQTINGAGSSFIYPVMAKWAAKYHQLTQTEINYQPIGSGGGLQQIYAKTIDFAASDMPLKTAKLKQKQLIQFPMIIGGIVPIIHLKGIKDNQLVLSGPVLARIYQSQITHWNNPSIAKLNPGITLPDTRIITIHRADGSGTTFNFTHYLSKVSPSWKKDIGASTIVNWPGFGIGAKGNAGVAAQVAHVPNAIGYVEYAYASENHLTLAKMINHSGKVVSANATTFSSAAKHANYQVKNSFHTILTNQPGDNSWPIVATTFVLMPKHGKPSVIQTEQAFFKWCYQKGQAMAASLDYVAIPKKVYQKVMHTWQAEK